MVYLFSIEETMLFYNYNILMQQTACTNSLSRHKLAAQIYSNIHANVHTYVCGLDFPLLTQFNGTVETNTNFNEVKQTCLY